MQKQNKTKPNQITRQEFVVVFFFASSVASIRRNEVKPNNQTNEPRITIDRIKSEIVVMNRLNKIESADSTLNRNICVIWWSWHTYVLHAYIHAYHTRAHKHISRSPPIRHMMTMSAATAPADHIQYNIHIFAAHSKGIHIHD